MLITIDEILEKENKTRYWLSKQINITYQNLCNIADNKTASIKFDILEKICLALKCTPNDILKIGSNNK